MTASWWEILAAFSNIVGALAAVWMYRRTRQRHRSVIATGGTADGPRVIVAWRHYRCEGTRIAFHLLMLIVSLWAMTLPDPVTAFGWTNAVIRTVLAILFAGASLMDVWSDDHLMALLGGISPRKGA